MATSGSTSASGSWASATLEVWKNWHSVEGNYTSVHYKLTIYRQYNIISSASKSYSIQVNGSTVASGSTTIGGSGTKIIKEGDVNVYHNADGSKWLSFGFSQQFDVTLHGTWVGTLSNSSGFWLDDIPRASQPSGSDPDGWYWYGENITIYTNPASSSFTHTLRYSWSGYNGEIARGVKGSHTWTIPKSFINAIPNDTWSWGTIFCDTYNGNTFIGTKSFTIHTAIAWADGVPNITAVNHSEANATVKSAIGAYVQGNSRLNISMSGVSTQYGATIKSYAISFDGSNYSSSSASTGAIKGSGNLTISATVTDSRGYTVTKTATVNVLAYSPPIITSLSTERANSNGTLNQVGTHVRVDRAATVSSLVSGTEKNTLTYTVKTRERGTTAWTTKVNPTTISGRSLTGNNIISSYPIDKSYEIRIEVSDKLNTTIALSTISTGRVTMSWGGTGAGIGKIWERGGLDVEGDVYVNGRVKENGATLLPPGVIVPFASHVTPSGWLICHGQAVSRTDYADLFAVIGTTYGGGNGSTTFNVPDMRGRVPVGYNSLEAEFNVLNKKGGAKTHKLTEDEMARHWHSLVWMNSVDSSTGAYYTDASLREGYGTGTKRTLWSHGAYADYAGGDQPHNNLQPYNTLNYIIKC